MLREWQPLRVVGSCGCLPLWRRTRVRAVGGWLGEQEMVSSGGDGQAVLGVLPLEAGGGGRNRVVMGGLAAGQCAFARKHGL